MSGADAMLRMAARARALGQLGARAAEEARPKLEAVARELAASGAPDGERWKPRKDGGQPLAGAAGSIVVRVAGHVLQMVVRGYHVFHQRGTSRLPQRKIIPAPGDSLPARYAEALGGGAVLAFQKAVRS